MKKFNDDSEKSKNEYDGAGFKPEVIGSFDLERMKKALNSPTRMMPLGLTSEERRQKILDFAKDIIVDEGNKSVK